MNPIIRTRFAQFIEQKGAAIPILPEDIDLTDDQKRNKLIHWLDNDPRFFFDQVQSYLPPDLVNLWSPKAASVVSPAQPTAHQLTPSQHRFLIHNRRYHYLIDHLRHSDYFSEESIQLRTPSLYEEYIGQHIPDDERFAPFEDSVSLVDRVYDGMNRRYVHDQWQRKKRTEEEQLEEQDDDDDEPLAERSTNQWAGTREEKKDELIRLLEEQWMDGLDDTFDYTTVDQDETYDDLAQQNQDIQDRYFDDEMEAENGPNNDTGVLDY
ncbi:hypothetical protein [Absidia glauca]|uniref:CCD97-like C-terminal domain-containing protein n=1 Tax=Absidia glauca TaxID=4829 RepID=A0A168R1B2_ABSGL|nr:hypothetical protein [Absidia glauca]